jgi:predicted PurR-regulated permease PerM
LLKIEVSARGVLLIGLSLAVMWALIQLWSVIVLLLVSFILMLGLLPYVDAMVRRGIPRTGAVLLLLLAFIGGLVVLFSIMVPAIVQEAGSVRDNLPESARQIENLLSSFGIHVQLQDRARNINWDELISGRAAVDYTQRVATVVFSIVTIIVLTAYLLADTPRLGAFASQFIPPDRKEEADRLFWSLTWVVGGFLRGQAITSLAIGVFTFVFLRIVGVPNPLAFAVLAAFADVIPLIGAFIAIIPPVAAALQDSSTQALIVLIGLFLYQQFEDRFLIPRVYGRTLNLPPIIVLIAVLAGAELLGITGVLLALPLAAAARVGMDYLMANRSWPWSQLENQVMAPDSDLGYEDDPPEPGNADNEHRGGAPEANPQAG